MTDPTLRGADTPPTHGPESNELEHAIAPPVGRTTYLLIPPAIVSAIVYFTWILQGAQVGNPILFAFFFGAQTFNIVSAAGFWWTVTAGVRGRDQIGDPASRAHDPGAPLQAVVPPRTPKVDVLVPTYNEPVDLIEPTIAAATRLEGAVVTVYVLDDGDRPKIAELAERYGVRYLARRENFGAKAGNLNNALQSCEGEFVAVLDCDHVPHRDLLRETLRPLLDGEDVGFVQSPQFYRNHDESEVAEAAWSQQRIFFGPISRGKDVLGAMICCGTNVTFRREALDRVGGFPIGTVTEDFSLGISLHETGWRSVYVPTVLAKGLAPVDMSSYVSQQNRWARGCISAIPRILRSRMSAKLKAQYLLSASYFLNGWTLFVYMSLPAIYLFTGAQPLAQSTASAIVTYFLPYFFFAMLIVNVASGWTYSFRAFSLASSIFWVHILSTLQALSGRSGRFVVTPKQGRPTGRQVRPVAPALLMISVLMLACVYGANRTLDAASVNNISLALLHVSVLLVGIWPALRSAGAPLSPESTVRTSVKEAVGRAG